MDHTWIIDKRMSEEFHEQNLDICLCFEVCSVCNLHKYLIINPCYERYKSMKCITSEMTDAWYCTLDHYDWEEHYFRNCGELLMKIIME